MILNMTQNPPAGNCWTEEETRVKSRLAARVPESDWGRFVPTSCNVSFHQRHAKSASISVRAPNKFLSVASSPFACLDFPNQVVEFLAAGRVVARYVVMQELRVHLDVDGIRHLNHVFDLSLANYHSCLSSELLPHPAFSRLPP